MKIFITLIVGIFLGILGNWIFEKLEYKRDWKSDKGDLKSCQK